MNKSLPNPANKQDDKSKPWYQRLWSKPGYFVPLALVVVVIGGVVLTNWHLASNGQARAAGTCTPNAILVNPCRPWFGAAAHGNPGAPNDPISQADYLETLVGQHLDIFRFYHSPGDLPLDKSSETGKAEIHFAQRANTYIDVNWKPASTWAAADGSNATVNAEIKQAANNIKAVGHTIFLTIWHEPENDVSAFDNSTEQAACQSDPNFKGLKGSAGTPDQYKAMWSNVQKIFQQVGVTNVVWAMDYMSYPPFYCLIPYLWPGNQLVNWVLYDTYGHNKEFTDTAGAFYNVLLKDSSASVNLDSKPWGLGEFNDCNPKVPQNAITYFNQAEAAFKANTYPRLKMYLVYADTGNNSGPGCLTNYNDKGQPFPAKQTAFNQLARAVLNS
ncbi:MAG TPA: hypothetical protein VKV19_13865 [Ktedonobacteraceae bacterium]|nr:hypothetical protein [Ktedonobacteraceae bacterium]